MKIIRSAVLKLTLAYLGIILLITIGFSAFVYNLSSQELSRGLRRSVPTYFYQPNLNTLREQQISQSEAMLLSNLVLVNLAALVLGGGASYWLARRTLRPIQAAIEAQSRFTADASHELRTPLTAMQTEIEVALRNGRLTSAEARSLLESNLEEVAKLRDLSEGLLKLTRQEGRELTLQPVEIMEVVRQASARYEKAAAAKHIELSLSGKPVTAKGDPTSLIELVCVLIDNGIKYSPVKSTLKLAVTQTKNQVLITVIDQGIGIKASDLPHIFDRFYRADTSRSKEQVEGYGLGLSLAQHIADSNNAVIEVSTLPGEGSTFTVKLPRADEKI